MEKKKDSLKRRKNLIFKQTYYEIKIKLYVLSTLIHHGLYLKYGGNGKNYLYLTFLLD